jgi:hypothetical protein
VPYCSSAIYIIDKAIDVWKTLVTVQGQKVFLYLTGGLGNQLFQFAALNAIAYESEKHIISNFGHPRKNTENFPEITSILEDKISFVQLKSISPKLVEKVIGLNLRLTIGKSSFLKRCFRFFVQALSNIAISILVMKFFRIVFIVHKKPNRFFRNTILVGYFQVADYSQSLCNLTREIQSIEHPALKDLLVKSKNNPLIIHVRRGDYLFEKDFGVLHVKYYKEAFLRFSTSHDFNSCNSIWIFSDDIDYARRVINLETDLECEWISEIGGSASLTLLAMSLGSTFIIANSTFSWWAAQLSRDRLGVYYPCNWFKNIPVDERLFPQDWVAIDNEFEDNSSGEKH